MKDLGNTMISMENIVKNYGSNQVLKGVNMHVNKGDIYGLIGKNGAGKTTIFKLILGLSEFQDGNLSIMGAENEEDNRRARKKIGFFVGTSFFGYLNARDNLHYYRRVKGISDKSEVDRVLELVGLTTSAAKAPAKKFSLGMRQRLGIANALLGDPDILILDEPINGLDPQGIADIRNMIIKLNEEQGKTFVISSHILSELEHTAHRFGIVNEGVLMKELSRNDMKQNKEIVSIDIANGDLEKAKEVLVANGIDIRRISQGSSSLEEFYFKLVGGDR